ncbi:MAG TPA: hypothetical protein VFS12_18540 [Terriglobia bacterium]|nr:hypothetical protein [Terriglobia bacterium]
MPVGIQAHFEVRSGASNITSLLSGGEVAGLVEIQDQEIPAYLRSGHVGQNNHQPSEHVACIGHRSPDNAGDGFFNPTPEPALPQVLPAGLLGIFL